MLPAVDRLGMPLVTSGQFAYVFKLNSEVGGDSLAVRCFRGFLRGRALAHELGLLLDLYLVLGLELGRSERGGAAVRRCSSPQAISGPDGGNCDGGG